MKFNQKFSEELFLTNKTGSYLYHTYAEQLPIIDYHCHLSIGEIHANRRFSDIGEIWLSGDHYKWRAMRAFGIDERYITGDASYYEKFMAYAAITPKLAGNPLYIWNALELKRYFGIDEPLGPDNAEEIYTRTKRFIEQSNVTPRWCMEKMKVRLVCTTEDPAADLDIYREEAKKPAYTKVITAFRPDKAMFAEKPHFADYLKRLGAAAGRSVGSFEEMLCALSICLKKFGALGSTVSDDGIPDFTYREASGEEIARTFQKAVAGEDLSSSEIAGYRTAFLLGMGRLYHENGFVMQLHIGTYQDTNTARVRQIGEATGFDCVDDSTGIKSVGHLLDRLSGAGKLPKTILYPLNPTQIESFAILAAAFCEGSAKGKVQLGAPWWFNDQAYGLARQFVAVSNLYPVSLSVGMLTDSRSFLSYPRHELYRRVLCDYLGSLIEKGEYFSEEKYVKEIIEDICYNNVNEYFNFKIPGDAAPKP